MVPAPLPIQSAMVPVGSGSGGGDDGDDFAIAGEFDGEIAMLHEGEVRVWMGGEVADGDRAGAHGVDCSREGQGRQFPAMSLSGMARWWWISGGWGWRSGRRRRRG